MSFPPGTEMFQFPGFASAAYGFSDGYPLRGGLPHSEILGINACSRLPRAFRSVPRPSSPLGAKASTRCPCFPRPTPATTAPPGHEHGRTHACRRMGDSSVNSLYNEALASGTDARASIPMPFDAPAHRRKKRGRRIACQRPSTHDARRLERTFMPADGLYHHHTMSKEQSPAYLAATGIATMPQPSCRGGASLSGRPGRNPSHEGTHPKMRAWWAWADLNGRPHAYQACALTN